MPLHEGTYDMLLNQQRARQLMRDSDIDALVLTYTENNVYFGDFLDVNSSRLKSRLYYTVFFAEENRPPAYLVPHQDFEDVKRHTWIEDVRATGEFPIPGRPGVIFDKEAAVAEIIADRGLSAGAIGYEDLSLPVTIFENLKRALPNFEFKKASQLIHRLRAVKSPEELRRIKRAMDITQAGARAILQAAGPGVSEKELASLAEQALFDAGAESLKFIIVGAAANGAVVHGAPTDYRLSEGDIVRFDLGAVYQGYPGDFARTFVVGNSPRERDVMHYRAVYEAVQAGMGAVRPGVTAGEIYATQMKAGQAIDPDLTREHAGHGMGLEVHEEPMIYDGSSFVLESGMVVMIENGRYVNGHAGYQLEDLVLVTDTGYEVVTDVPRQLVIQP